MTTNSRIHYMTAGAALGLALLTANCATAQQAAIHTEFSGTEVHVTWLAQPAPEFTKSGHMKITGWEHLYYDDADDDRLDGYDTVYIDAMLDSNGEMIHGGGRAVLREKLDNIEPSDFVSGEFDPDDIVQGEILFEGIWRMTPHQGVTGLFMNSEGLKASYTFMPSGDFVGRLLDPNNVGSSPTSAVGHGARIAQSIPEPSAFLLALIALSIVGGWRKWKERAA